MIGIKVLVFAFILKTVCIRSVNSWTSLRSLTNSEIYDQNEVPTVLTEEGSKLPVNVTLAVIIEKISFKNNEFPAILKLHARVSWIDHRLKFTDTLDPDYGIRVFRGDLIWAPSLVFIAQLDETDFPYESYYINQNGTVDGSMWIKLNLPFDELSTFTGFSLRLISLHPTEDVTLQWDEDVPLKVSEYQKLFPSGSDIVLENFDVSNCSSHGLASLARRKTGKFGCLELTMKIDNETNYPLLFIYIPGILSVMLSWAAFWIEISSVLGRWVVILTSVLHLFIQKVAQDKHLLLVGDSANVNAWQSACLGFVFITFCQMVFVTYLYSISTNRLSKRHKRLSVATTIEEEEEAGDAIVEDSATSARDATILCNPFHFPRTWVYGFHPTAEGINRICRILFPLCFAIYLCVFFVVEY